MRGLLPFAAMMLAAAAGVGPAFACMVYRPLDLRDIRRADVVVEGRLENWTAFTDPEIQRIQREALIRHFGEDSPEPARLSDRVHAARFDIVVGRVLRGEARDTLTVWWDPSTFGTPRDVAPARVLIGLRKLPSVSGAPAKFGADPTHFITLRMACSPPFIFDPASENAARIRGRFPHRLGSAWSELGRALLASVVAGLCATMPGLALLLHRSRRAVPA